ncbi:dehydrogenase [Paenibacillus illinoisensis]|uniref:dehydrogenase n=1 Tax=Paenibacillus illinoisensis TaxID=59845 RepID=UPI003D2D6A4D
MSPKSTPGIPPVKHSNPSQKLPSARGIRRACSKELYRTAKRLKVYISPDQMKQAEELYYGKVIANLLWIGENRDNRKKLCEWWNNDVSADIASLWNVDIEPLQAAFQQAFGGYRL